METLDEEHERIERERRHAKAARLCEVVSLQAAADKFVAAVDAHATEPDVTALAAELLVIAACQRRRKAELERERSKLRHG